MRPDPSEFGHIPGIPVGTTWDSRKTCSDSAVHPGILAGIYGSAEEGARSIAMSGGYEDDEDLGETFTYTGCGGRDLHTHEGKKRRTGPQSFDQSFDNRYNRALQVSSMTKKPVRVIRGSKLNSIYAPAEGYRYDGLYKVEKAWTERGKAGHVVCRFLFERLPGQSSLPRLSYALNLNNIKKSARAKRREDASTHLAKVPARDERRLPEPPPLKFILPPRPAKPSTHTTHEMRMSVGSSEQPEAGPLRLPMVKSEPMPTSIPSLPTPIESSRPASLIFEHRQPPIDISIGSPPSWKRNNFEHLLPIALRRL